MTTDERREFGRYMRGLRERSGLTLREVAGVTNFSVGYLTRIEMGLANAPDAAGLARLAIRFEADVAEVAEKAGRMDYLPTMRMHEERYRLHRAYTHTQLCKRYQSHSLYSGPLTDEIRRFCVEMYERGTGRNPLECDCGGRF